MGLERISKALAVINLNLFSHTEADRRPLFLKMIGEGGLHPGCAFDETAGLYFEGTQLRRVISQNIADKGYKVDLQKGKVVETALESDLI